MEAPFPLRLNLLLRYDRSTFHKFRTYGNKFTYKGMKFRCYVNNITSIKDGPFDSRTFVTTTSEP